MTSIKRHIRAFALTAVVTLCGCENTKPEPPEPYSGETGETIAAASDLPVTENNSDTDFSSSRIYADDKLVPKEWLKVFSHAEALEHFEEIVNSDTSELDAQDAVLSLVNKNVLFFELFFVSSKGLFEIDWNSPYETEDLEKPVYPFKSKFFPNIESIYNLAFNTYDYSVADEFLFGTPENPKTFFFEENGCTYINNSVFPIWSADAFISRTYIEITNISEENCTFVWHYPDLERLNEPVDYQYFYYEKTYTADYKDGTLKLNDIIFNN